MNIVRARLVSVHEDYAVDHHRSSVDRIFMRLLRFNITTDSSIQQSGINKHDVIVVVVVHIVAVVVTVVVVLDIDLAVILIIVSPS